MGGPGGTGDPAGTGRLAVAYAIGTRPGTSPVVDGLYERLLDRAEKTCAAPTCLSFHAP